MAQPFRLAMAPRRRRRGDRGLFLCPPFHSTANPPVGLAYLRSFLAGYGFSIDVCDLNIEGRDALRADAPPGPGRSAWLAGVEELFPQSRRSYLGEALTWSWHDPEGQPAIARRALTHDSVLLREFWQGAGIRRLDGDPLIAALGDRLHRWITRRVAALAQQPWDFFGFSLTVGNQAAAFEAAALVRELRPEALIVAGGPHVNSRNAVQLLEACAAFDAAIPAPAFRPLLRLLKSDPVALAGAACRVGADIVWGGNADDVELDELPTPDWTGIDLQRYAPSFDIHRAWNVRMKDTRTLPMQTSRGCSYSKCEFCHNVIDYPKLLTRSPARISQDIAQLNGELGVRSYFFTDDEFNASKKRCIEIADALLRSAPEIRFFAWLRLDKIDEPLLEKLYESGCRQIFVGVEAVDDSLLELLMKGYSAEQALDRLRRLHRFTRTHHDFSYYFNLIIDHPRERADSIRRTWQTIQSEPELFVGRAAALCRYHLYEGTPAFAHFGENAPGVLDAVVPEHMAVDSFRYLPPAQRRPDAADRLGLWRQVAAALSQDSQTQMARSIDDSIYD
jgi:Radical SAM superfamily